MNPALVAPVRSTRSVMALTSKIRPGLESIKMLALCASIFFLLGVTRVSAQVGEPQRSEDLQLGIRLIEERNFAHAAQILKHVTSKEPENPEGWFYFGVASIETMFLKEASDALRKSIELRPDYAPAHTFLADALLRQGALPEAALEADKALTIKANDPYASYTRSFISLRQRAFDDAVKYAEFATNEKPDFTAAHMVKAQALIGTYKVLKSESDEELKNNLITRYRSAAESLAQYVQLETDADKRQIWQNEIEQLNSFPLDDPTVFSPKNVDTKARIIQKPEPTYSEEARRYRITGTVILKAVFASDGAVKKILIVQALPCGLTENSVKAASKIQFTPAMLNGQPVSTSLQLEYSFNLY